MPPALANARRRLEFALSHDGALIDKRAADGFWAERCAKQHGKSPDEAANCLKDIFGREPLLAGAFNIDAVIVETRPGNRVAKFFAPVADAVAPPLKTALISHLDPTAREQAKEAREKEGAAQILAARQAGRSASIAELEVRSAQIGYDESVRNVNANPSASNQQAVIKQQIALLKAQRDANDAFRAAGLEIPFPLVD